MASRTASRALRASVQQLAKQPAVQRRSFIAAANTVRAAPKVAVSTGMQQQRRGKKTIDFAGVKEEVYGRSFEWYCVVAAGRLLTCD
jgi:ketol-acid reductoisomerase